MAKSLRKVTHYCCIFYGKGNTSNPKHRTHYDQASLLVTQQQQDDQTDMLSYEYDIDRKNPKPSAQIIESRA